MRVLTMNVNGLRSALRRGFADLVAELDPDVACLQEIRCLPHQVTGLPDGRAATWHPAERPGYSGVATLTRRAPDAVETGIGDPAFDAEGRLHRVELPEATIVNVYVPSGTTGDVRQAVKMRFLGELTLYLAALIARGREVLVCGDVNVAHREIDLKNWRSNRTTSGFLPEERAWFSSLLELGLRDVVRDLAGDDAPVYTWWSQRAGARERDVGWRIDYQLATPGLAGRARSFEVPRTPVLSDHAPVVVTYEPG